MRPPGVDYVYLFKAFSLVPLETPLEYSEATLKMAWLESRTEPTKSTLDFKYVLGLLIKDYEDREAAKPTLAESIQMLAESDEKLSAEDRPEGEEIDIVQGSPEPRKPGRPRKDK